MNQPKLRQHEKYGYWYYPVNQKELDEYYVSAYQDPLNKGDDLAELTWKQSTLWADIAEWVKLKGGGVLDIGNGNGSFAKFLQSIGIYVKTLDKNGYADYDDFSCVDWGSIWEPGQAIKTSVMLNVLEHVADPVKLLRKANKSDRLVVRVPNDLNPLQMELQRQHGQYWLHFPDHISYFSVDSLMRLLDAIGWKVKDVQCDYPMELYLLSGLNYLDDPEIGRICHQRRRKLEMAINSNIRQDMWRKNAQVGIGRNIIVYAERR